MIIIRKFSISNIYLLFISVFTIYVLLNTFVLSEVYKVESTKETKTSIATGEVTSDDDTYTDDNVEITLKEYRKNNTTIYVADVVLKNQSLLKTAFANNSYGKNITAKTSAIAQNVGAILAINGDYYGVHESGYVLRNGTIYRSSSNGNDDLVIYKDGTFEIVNEDDVSLETLKEKGAYNILSFGPALITDGNVSVSENDEVGRSMASNPRTAIGKISDNHYIFVVSDGRTDESAGLSLYQLANFMKELDCSIAYNLDGGGSSTMYFNNKIVNNPTTNGRISERSVSDIVYIGY